ncbi:MAG: hypothetical protein IPJ19_18905 [Planctomycetes bacterium]|nr:hypothetical protein [Planctomycetota bacterium]
MKHVLVRSRALFAVVAFLALVTVVLSSVAQPPAAPIIYRVDAANTTPGNGSSWQAAFTKIEDALPFAQSGDQIWVKQGGYVPPPTDGYVVATNIEFYGGFDGTETTLAQRAGLFSATVLNAQGSARSFTLLGPVPSPGVVIDGFTIVNGDAAQCITQTGNGGAILSDKAQLLLSKCELSSNKAPSRGGALCFFDSAEQLHSLLNIKLCTFKHNIVGEGRGGAVFGAQLLTGDIINTVFESNLSGFVQNSTVPGPWDGGAVYLDAMLGSHTMFLTNCVFFRNDAIYGGHGGGLCLGQNALGESGAAQVVNCTFVRNATDNPTFGLALYVYQNATCKMHNSIMGSLQGTTQWNGLGTSVPYVGTVAPLTYSDIEGQGAVGTNISKDPEFRSRDYVAGLTLRGTSPCLDNADAGMLPIDRLDINEDAVSGQIVPIDLAGARRDVDWIPAAQPRHSDRHLRRHGRFRETVARTPARACARPRIPARNRGRGRVAFAGRIGKESLAQ